MSKFPTTSKSPLSVIIFSVTLDACKQDMYQIRSSSLNDQSQQLTCNCFIWNNKRNQRTNNRVSTGCGTPAVISYRRLISVISAETITLVNRRTDNKNVNSMTSRAIQFVPLTKNITEHENIANFGSSGGSRTCIFRRGLVKAGRNFSGYARRLRGLGYATEKILNFCIEKLIEICCIMGSYFSIHLANFIGGWGRYRGPDFLLWGWGGTGKGVPTGALLERPLLRRHPNNGYLNVI